MTALSNLVSKLDCPQPELEKLFTREYCYVLLKKIDDKVLNAVKTLVDNYVRNELKENIINYRIYSYKTLEGITAEILIQPENSSIIIQYLLNISEKNTKLVRIR